MRIFIETLQQAKRELAKTYREYKAGELKDEQARTRVTILRAIVEANFKYELEQRVIELEKKTGV